MKRVLSRIFAGFLWSLLGMAVACAAESIKPETHWHCSRVPDTSTSTGGWPMEGGFQLASTGMSPHAVTITVLDLLDAYSGKPVRINGRLLTACFMVGDSPLSRRALKSLGLNAGAMQPQARKSALVKSHFQLVTDEHEMRTCIARHYPAVGYLDHVVENDRVVPCF